MSNLVNVKKGIFTSQAAVLKCYMLTAVINFNSRVTIVFLNDQYKENQS